jgi:hypothetical protein
MIDKYNLPLTPRTITLTAPVYGLFRALLATVTICEV